MSGEELEDEPTEAELAEEARVDQALSASSAAVGVVIEECHDAFGHGILTVVLGQVGQWYRDTARSTDTERARDAARAADVLSALYGTGGDYLQTAIATGFLEALPHPHEQERDVVELLPTPLREELRRMEGWSPAGLPSPEIRPEG